MGRNFGAVQGVEKRTGLPVIGEPWFDFVL